MTTEITQEMVRALSDESLANAKTWIAGEEVLRIEERKHEAIARIKALAHGNGFSVTINGIRGRPRKEKRNSGSGLTAK